MAIDYVLHENTLPTGSGFRATIKPWRTLNMEDLIERICRLETSVGEADVRSVLANLFNVIENAVLDGMNVTTPIANFSVSVRGIFEGEEDRFDPTRHRIMPRVGSGSRYRRTIGDRAQLNKRDAALRLPSLFTYTDGASGQRNQLVTPGGTSKLTGRRLKFDPQDPGQGVFFVAADRSATRVEVVVENQPHKLIFTVPALSPGEYTLEVRILGGGDRIVAGALEWPLTVA